MKTVPLRRTATILNGGTPTSDAANWNGAVPWATPVDLRPVDGRSLNETQRTLTHLGVQSGSTLAPAGSLIISTRAPIGYTVLTERDMAFNQGCKALLPHPHVMDARFLQLQLMASSRDLQAAGSGSTFMELSAEVLGATPVSAPSLDTQRRIADFLDDHVGRIDRIIAARQQQIEKLAHLNQTFLQGAVRGEPEHQIRVGGWLGTARVGWSIVRLGSLFRFYAGAGFPHDEQGNESGDLPFIKVGDMAASDDRLRLGGASNWVSRETADSLGANVAPTNTILFPKVGAALLTNRRSILSREAVFDNNVMGIFALGGNARFWLHVLRCVDMSELANPGPVPSVSRSAVAEIRLPSPPNDEQEKIAKVLDERAESWTLHKAALTRSIDLLTEYKQSLITAAVTGQLDVTTASTRIPE